MTQTDTDTTTESDGVLDTLEQKMDAFEDRIGLHTVRGRVRLAKGAAYYTMATATVGTAAAQNNSSAIGSSICNAGLGGFISQLLGILLAVGFIGAVYAMVRSGLKFMNSGGDPEKKSSARESLMMSFFGAGLVIFVTFLPSFLNSLLGGTTIATCYTPF
jgi:hypothetical protein